MSLPLPLLAVLAAAPRPHHRAVRVDTPPVLDGKVDDAAWRQVGGTTEFTQKFPRQGDDPSERTTLRIAYDDEAVYVAFECEQTGVPVVERLTRRGRLVESDWVSIAFGTRRDGKTAFEFLVNASGVRVDSLRFNDTEKTEDRDQNWEAATSLTERGWSAELRIPLHLLRFAESPEQSWDLQARRYTSKRQETDEWAYFPRSAGGEVSNYGKLDGLSNLQARAPMQLRPFVVGRMARRDPSDVQLESGTELTASAGADLKWLPSRDLTLDLTMNPDFAQVEADQVVLNLSNFETYFPERRPFFLEGIDTFTTPIQLLYTRRIGRAPPSPRLRDSAPFDEELLVAPTARTIYGASKLTGQLGAGWTIGTLQALSGESTVDVQLGNGERARRLVEPLTGHQVFRLRREIGDHAYLGAMFTATTYAEPNGRFALVPPGDGSAETTLLCPNAVNATSAGRSLFPSTRSGPSTRLSPTARCFNNAYVGSIDGLWRSPGGDWTASMQAAASSLQGGSPRHVPDGTVIHPGDVGTALSLAVRKQGGDHSIGAVTTESLGRKFDANDLGFQSRSNQHKATAQLEYRELERWGPFLETHARFSTLQKINSNGLDLGGAYQITAWGSLANFWKVWTTLYYQPRYFDDRELGNGAALERASVLGYELWFETDRTKPVSFELWAAPMLLPNGHRVIAESGVLFRVMPAFDLALLPTASYQLGEPRFIGVGGTPDEYLFGRLTAASVGGTLRATYTFTPRLTLQTYAQLLLASGHYGELSSYRTGAAPPRKIHLAELRPYTGELADNPDFVDGVMNLNVVLRWEYRLGSIAYLVYTRAQTPEITLGARETARPSWSGVTRAPAVDVLLLKLSYWWS